MAKVRVEVRNHPLARCVGSATPTPFGLPFFRPTDATGLVARLPWYRLLVKVVVLPTEADPLVRPVEVPETHSPAAILDTGAPLTCFPATLWRQFAPEIRWLDQPPREDGEPWRMTDPRRVVDVSPRSHPTRRDGRRRPVAGCRDDGRSVPRRPAGGREPPTPARDPRPADAAAGPAAVAARRRLGQRSPHLVAGR